MNKKLQLGIILFCLGMAGVLTLLTMTIPLDNLPKEVLQRYSPEDLQLLMLINPALILLIAVIGGTLLFDKVGLEVPFISRLIHYRMDGTGVTDQLRFGAGLGIISGVLILVIGAIFHSFLPVEFLKIGKQMEISVLSRFLYGGITEELLMRFGFMTFVIWLLSKWKKGVNDRIYWAGIILSTLLFAVGHFPVAFTVVDNPSAMLLMYILLGNSVAGIFFGWLYWKKGLEAAFIGHIFAHIIMLAGESIFKL